MIYKEPWVRGLGYLDGVGTHARIWILEARAGTADPARPPVNHPRRLREEGRGKCRTQSCASEAPGSGGITPVKFIGHLRYHKATHEGVVVVNIKARHRDVVRVGFLYRRDRIGKALVSHHTRPAGPQIPASRDTEECRTG
jgi:hypothetical protein